jgi:hypothetical protein
MEADLLDVRPDFLAPSDRVAEEHHAGHFPLVGEVAELEQSIELEVRPKGRERRHEQVLARTSARSTRRRRWAGVILVAVGFGASKIQREIAPRDGGRPSARRGRPSARRGPLRRGFSDAELKSGYADYLTSDESSCVGDPRGIRKPSGAG